MEKEFQWTDDLVREFVRHELDTMIQTKSFNVGGDMIIFKSNHSPKEERKPLFTTEDGVDKYEGDDYWIVGELFDSPVYSPAIQSDSELKKNYPTNKRFSTEQAAKEYIANNKPSISYQDLKDFFGNSPDWKEKITLNHFKPKL